MILIKRAFHRAFIFALAAGIFAGTSRSRAANDSALPHDPADRCGQFDNGLHYLIRKNANPPGKVFLNLAVRTGSLNETEEQNGLAHFLEHMAFKGSTHFAPTRLIPTLTHLGMRFGADTNAHTNRYETVFKLSMPDTKPETINLALTIFSDYANGLSLYPIQIESERRVILEEIRSRRNMKLREQAGENYQLFPGSRMTVHDVLGNPEIIKNAKQPLFADYWNHWYRPENMTLIVVGDIDPQAIIAQAKPLLGNFVARAPAEAAQSAGLKSFDQTKVVVISDPEQVAAELEILNLQPVRSATTTVAQYQHEIIEAVAESILNRRMSNWIIGGHAPFQKASVSSGDYLRDGFMVAADASSEPQDWQKALTGIIVELNRAVTHGFIQNDLDTVRDSMMAGATQAATAESSLDSSSLVTYLTSAIDTDRPMMSSQQRLELIKELLPTITLDDLQQAFQADFKASNYAYVLKLPPAASGKPLPVEQNVLAIANSAWKQKTSAFQPPAPTTQLLPVEPVGGQVASRERDSDLGLTNVVFENGVLMHHMFSDYKKNQVLIQVVMPGGILEETSDNHYISAVASLMVKRPATNHLSSLQIRELLNGKDVSLRGGIGLDSLDIGVTGSPKDIPLGLQLVNAILTDGKLEQPAVDEWKNSWLQSLRNKAMRADAQLADAKSDTVLGGDVRFSPMTVEVIQRQQCEAAQAWFKHIADHSAIEVSVVGDISADDAVTLIGKYFGSLPHRSGTFTDLDSLRVLKRKTGPYAQTLRYNSVEPKALVMAGFIGCEEHDSSRRPLGLASLILTERMVQHLRFDQQIVYSIGCTATPSHGLPGTGLIAASAPTDPHTADRLADGILSIIKEFAATGPTDDELVNAKKQIANQLDSQMKDPAFWLAQISELQYHQRPNQELKQIPGIFQTFTADQVRDAVRVCATNDRLVRLEILPDDPAGRLTPESATNPVSK